MSKSSFTILLSAVLILLALTTIAPARAAEGAWTDAYNLTPTQLVAVQNMEKSRGLDQAISFAKAIQKWNSRKPVYIPAHAEGDIEAVTNWAQGEAFAYMAKYTAYRFNVEQFVLDCPNRALYNFGAATYTEYLRTDVLASRNQVFQVLLFKWSQDPKGFSDDFMQLAQQRGFAKYLTTVSLDMYLRKFFTK